jgi:hypothetical protein
MTELRGGHKGAARLGQIVGAQARGEHAPNRRFDARGLILEPEALAQQQRQRQQLGHGVCAIGAAQILRRAMIGLINGGAVRREVARKGQPA